MANLTVRFPDELYSELGAQVDGDQFASKNEAVRYYVRAGLQREVTADE